MDRVILLDAWTNLIETTNQIDRDIMKTHYFKGTYINDREALARNANKSDPMNKFPLPGDIEFAGYWGPNENGDGIQCYLTIGDYIMVTWLPGSIAKFKRTGGYHGGFNTKPHIDNVTAGDLNINFFSCVLLSWGLRPISVEDASETVIEPAFDFEKAVTAAGKVCLQGCDSMRRATLAELPDGYNAQAVITERDSFGPVEARLIISNRRGERVHEATI